ncbi:hypothetical protein IV203_019823 [Nitzschia inconspicua]|uniref:Uncharacterized protein n=1 Tax=Nitzschia inconspicua TaxID=303405 RepID=A0A9K3K5T4_9STRA|nr:hypothetical protein IV203_020392 [Nitzschia inconspicua]KAG7371253.1 hypothetical protein IV203_019823 [Nitzschia inconspicua]
MNTDSFPTIPRRLKDNNEERGSSIVKRRLPYAHSVSASSLSFVLFPSDSVPSCLAQPSKFKHRNSNVLQRNKSSSIVEVFMFPTEGSSPMKPNASFSEGCRDSRRGGSLTLSTGTNSLKRAGTSRSTGRRWPDLSKTSSVMTPTSCESMDDEEEDSEKA